MQGKKQYQEKLFISFQLSDHVGEDNFYRRLKKLLPLDWLYKATEEYYGSEGQQSIDPVVFFKLMLIGYLENLNSDRRIINMTKLRLDMLYFIGYNIDEALPWHSTLSRTRQMYGQEVFRTMFKKVLSLCIDKGMVSGKRQAIDSVFVQANASMESLTKKDIINDIDNYADELTDGEEELTGQVIKQNVIPDKVTITNENTWNKKVSNHTLGSTTDEDARVSVKPGKVRRLNYLAQVSVDTANHVITQIQSDYADKKDSQCLPALLQNTIDNLSAHELQVEEVLADGNYSSSEALRALENKNIEGYIPNFGQYKSSREGFEYNKEKDCFICSQGKVLQYKSIKESHGNGNKMKQYRSSAKDCSTCPLKNKCIGKSSCKTIAVTVDKDLFEKMHHRLQTSKARRLKKLRSSTVEPVLGTLVNFLGMRRVYTKGIKLADKCMLMAAMAYNLKKLLKWEGKKTKADVKALYKSLRTDFLRLTGSIKRFKTLLQFSFSKCNVISCEN
jgi:transposase